MHADITIVKSRGTLVTGTTNSNNMGHIIRTIVLALVVYCQTGYCQQPYFLGSPGIIRVEENKAVYFTWILNDTLNITEREYMYGDQTLCKFSDGQKTPLVNPDYSRYISCFQNDSFELIFPGENFIKEKFSLVISVRDEENEPTQEYSVTNSDAYLFIYRLPEVVVHFYPENITEGDTVTITCSATSTSLPVSQRLPFVYSWSKNELPNFMITDNDTLVIKGIRGSDSDITCTVRERDSPLIGIDHVHIDVIGNGDDVGDEEDKGVTGISLDTAKLAGIVGSCVLLVFLCLLAVIIYLCWERKHRPERHKKRPNAVKRLSMGPLSRNKRPIDDSYDATSSDEDSDHFYAEIRMSQVGDSAGAPKLPDRPLGPDGNCYSYADARKLGLPTVASAAQKPTLSDIYLDDNHMENHVKNDVDAYLGGVPGNRTSAPKDSLLDLPIPSTDAYAVVNKHTVVREDGEDDVVESATYIPLEQSIELTDTPPSTDTNTDSTPGGDGPPKVAPLPGSQPESNEIAQYDLETAPDFNETARYDLETKPYINQLAQHGRETETQSNREDNKEPMEDNNNSELYNLAGRQSLEDRDSGSDETTNFNLYDLQTDV